VPGVLQNWATCCAGKSFTGTPVRLHDSIDLVQVDANDARTIPITSQATALDHVANGSLVDEQILGGFVDRRPAGDGRLGVGVTAGTPIRRSVVSRVG
jgi:hypothetical protein